jgi:TRAF3-interacting protein 1
MDPDDTNVMIQILAKMVLKNVDTKDAVYKVTGVSNESPIVDTSASISEPPPSNNEESDAESPALPKEELKPQTERPVTSHQKVPQTDLDGVQPEPKKSIAPSPSPTPIKRKEEPPQHTEEDKDDEKSKEEEEQTNRLIPTLKKRERPMSARAPPPKLKPSQLLEETPSMVHIHKEDIQNDDDDDFIVQINQPEPEQLDLSEQHGALVQKILETKTKLQGDTIHKPDEKTDLKDIPELRNSIQQLCQSTNPLGKSLDYLQEDVDQMNKELENWKKSLVDYKSQSETQIKYFYVNRITKDSISPLDERLLKIEVGIREQV